MWLHAAFVFTSLAVPTKRSPPHGTSSKTMLVPKTSQIGNLVQVQNMSVEALSRTSPATYLARILALVKPRVCESPSSSVVIKLKQVVIQFTNVKIKTS